MSCKTKQLDHIAMQARHLGVELIAITSVFFLLCSSQAGTKHPYRYSIVDIPVSLKIGTVRTPEFISPLNHEYFIVLHVDKPKPFDESPAFHHLTCMLGITAGPLDRADCTAADEELLAADWTVYQDGQPVAHGSSESDVNGRYDDAKFGEYEIVRFLGDFMAKKGAKYVVEVKFTKDASPIDVTDPHLVIIREGLQ